MEAWGNTGWAIQFGAEAHRKREEILRPARGRGAGPRITMLITSSVRRGWDDGCGWEGGGVIQDYAPAFGKFSEVQGEDAGGLVGFAD